MPGGGGRATIDAVRYALALILAVAACRNAVAQSNDDSDAMFADVRAFCSIMAEASHQTLDHAERQLDAIKTDMAAIAALRAKHDKLAADTVNARARVAGQRREVDDLKLRLAHLSPVMIEERRLVGADLTAHLEVLDRFHQIEALLEKELAGIAAEIASRRDQLAAPMRTAVLTSESDLRRCIADARSRFK